MQKDRFINHSLWKYVHHKRNYNNKYIPVSKIWSISGAVISLAHQTDQILKPAFKELSQNMVKKSKAPR